MLKRKIQVPLKRYAHPEYLRDLCNRIEACYFSPDRDWSCIEAIFAADIKAMEQREPKVAPPVPPKPAVPTFKDGTPDVGVAGLARLLQKRAALPQKKRGSRA
jgi:hypothetical protein